jgi:hypothetical protein
MGALVTKYFADKVNTVEEEKVIPEVDIHVYGDEAMTYLLVNTSVSVYELKRGLMRFIQQSVNMSMKVIKVLINEKDVSNKIDSLPLQHDDLVEVIIHRIFVVGKEGFYLPFDTTVAQLIKVANDFFNIQIHSVDLYGHKHDHTSTYTLSYNETGEFTILEFDFPAIPIVDFCIKIPVNGVLTYVGLDEIVTMDIKREAKDINLVLKSGATSLIECPCRVIADRQLQILRHEKKRIYQDVEFLGKKVILLHDAGLPFDIGLEIVKMITNRGRK